MPGQGGGHELIIFGMSYHFEMEGYHSKSGVELKPMLSCPRYLVVGLFHLW
jgi:hypothetical protein